MTLLKQPFVSFFLISIYGQCPRQSIQLSFVLFLKASCSFALFQVYILFYYGVSANEQEEAGLEAARRRIAETREHEPTSNQWAEAVGIKRSSLDKILCNGRESRERINQSYRRLVVSIAARYQGKGLSLQDLIQVPTHISFSSCFPIYVKS